MTGKSWLLQRLMARLSGQDELAPPGQILLWEAIVYGSMFLVLMAATYVITCLLSVFGIISSCMSLIGLVDALGTWLSQFSRN